MTKPVINKEMKLEEALRRLGEVVKALDSEEIDLDSSLALYEEGVALTRLCNEKLSAAERRVAMLKINSDGEMTEADLPDRENQQ
jgi:exodeoxyribonuclease VII small subunit